MTHTPPRGDDVYPLSLRQVVRECSMVVLRSFSRFGYLPTMIVGLNLLAVYLVASGYSFWWIGVLFGVAVALSLLTERILPFEKSWNKAHADSGKDVAHGVIYEIANTTAIILLPFATMLVPWRSIWPSTLPIGVQLLLAIIIADFNMTMIHYWSHRVSWLWRLHSVHHGVHRLYSFNGLVRHPLHQMLDLAVGTFPLVLIGLPMEVAVLLAFAISVQLLVQHSNIDYSLGPFQKFLAVGPVHRLHHVNWAGQGDVNFGLFLTCWDRLLGTLKLSSERAPSAGDIGIQDHPHFPQNYMTQLVLPFTNYSADSTVEQPASYPER
jgi:sterol desaturase/sphingolipid hydroxylase (fatty acid hydroxylase superfamily)